MSAAGKISLQTQIAEIRREIDKRRSVYPRMVSKGSMRQAEAEMLIAYMEAVLSTLLFCRDNEAAIRACISERSA